MSARGCWTCSLTLAATSSTPPPSTPTGRVKGRVRTYVIHQQLLEHLPVPRAPVLEVGGRLVVYRRERSTRLAHRNTIQGTTSQRIFPKMNFTTKLIVPSPWASPS